MIDPEPYNLIRPETCVECGQPMRTCGRDGRCSRCLSPWPRVVCRGWKTVSGAPMRCADPVMQQGDPGGEEIQGQCPVCAEMDRQARALAQVRAARRVERWAREAHEVEEMTEGQWADLTRGK